MIWRESSLRIWIKRWSVCEINCCFVTDKVMRLGHAVIRHVLLLFQATFIRWKSIYQRLPRRLSPQCSQTHEVLWQFKRLWWQKILILWTSAQIIMNYCIYYYFFRSARCIPGSAARSPNGQELWDGCQRHHELRWVHLQSRVLHRSMFGGSGQIICLI